MVDTEVAVSRPQRWDEPFGDSMREVDVDRLLEVEPFRSIDPARFPPTLPLRDILRNDARIQRFARGDIIVREGDYGGSAFLALRGRVRVVLSGLSSETLGRQEPHTLGWWTTLRRVLLRSKLPEVRRAFSPPRRGEGAGKGRRVQAINHAVGQRGEPSHSCVFLQDVPRVLEQSNTVVLEAGEIFGELAALTRSPRTATVFAETDAVLVEIRWQGLRDLMRRTDALRQHVERLYRENSLRVHLRETPLLAELPPERLAAVADETTFETHGVFDWHETFESVVRRRPGDAIVDEPLIAEEGAFCDGLILIRSGFARQSRRYGHGHRTVAYLGRGQVFGLAEAIESAAKNVPTPWQYSLRALGYVDVLRIPTPALQKHVFPAISRETLERVAREHGASWAIDEALGGASPPEYAASSGRGRIDQGLLEFLVDRRLINGAQAMAIDLDRCTRCDDCVRACAATHDNNPRFIRQGPRHGSFQIAHACMHCIDPVCMIGCPTGAISRDAATGVVRINDQTCIGCSTCAQSCPYDNIQMVEIRDRRGAVLTDAATRQPLAQATKCDLCVDLAGGPACQRACPHDALVRLNLGNLGDVAAWLNRK
jgi:Fe-S-cluster-containing dehydrogenase component/CRP-like cAMP-binding protein